MLWRLTDNVFVRAVTKGMSLTKAVISFPSHVKLVNLLAKVQRGGKTSDSRDSTMEYGWGGNASVWSEHCQKPVII